MLTYTENVLELAQRKVREMIEIQAEIGQIEVGKGIIYVATKKELLKDPSSFKAENRTFFISHWKW